MIAKGGKQQIPPPPLRFGRDDNRVDDFRDRTLNTLEGALDVFVGVAEGYRAAVGAGCGMFGFAEFGEQPVNLCGVEGLVDLDGRVAGDGGCDAAAAAF